MGNRKLNWNFVDWQWMLIGSWGLGLLVFLVSGIWEFALQMMFAGMLVGGIILYVRRGILKLLKRR